MILYIKKYLFFCYALALWSVNTSKFPLTRTFLKFPVQEIPPSVFHQNLRVLQFNIL